MAEDNNQEKSLLKEAANKVKEKGKSAAKKTILQILKPILPYIAMGVGILLACLLTMGLMLAAQKLIQDTIDKFLGLFSSKTSTVDTSTEYSSNGQIVSFKENGAYKLNKEDLSKEILKEFEDQKVSNEQMGFDVEKLGDMIDKYVKAEVQTTYPKTECFGNDIDGRVIIKRAYIDSNGDSSKVIDLKYEKYEDFCKMVDNNNTNALTKFSLNPDTLALCIAKQSNTTQYIDFDGNVINTEGGGITKEEINYQEYIQSNTTPIQFLIALHLVSEDVNFMQEVLDMVLDKGKIELTYVDTKNYFEESYEYSGYIRRSYEPSPEELEQDLSPEELEQIQESSDTEVTIDNSNIREYYNNVPEYYKKITTSYRGKLYVTEADTWLTAATKKINQSAEPEDFPDEGDPITIKDTEASIYVGSIDTNDGETIDIIRNVKQFISEKVVSKSSITKFTVTNKSQSAGVDKFVELIEKYPKVKNNITTSASTIYYFLQQSEKTEKHEQIMRFVLYKLTGINYGVTEEDLDFLSNDFLKISQGYVETVETKMWFALRDAGYNEYAVAGIMGNLAQYGFKFNNLEDDFEENGTNSLGYTDETYTQAINDKTYTREQFVSDGAGYGLAQWKSDTRKGELYDFAQARGVKIDNNNMQIEFLIEELKKYQDDEWKNTDSVKKAARAFYLAFVNPDETTYNEQIGTKAQEFYKEYNGETRESYANLSYPAGTPLIYNGVSYFPVFDQYASEYQHVLYGGPAGRGEKTLTSSGCGTFSMASIVSGLLGNSAVNPISYLEILDEFFPSGGYYSYGNGSSTNVGNDNMLQQYYGLHSMQGNINELLAYAKDKNVRCAGLGGLSGASHYVAVVPAMDNSGNLFYVIDSALGVTGGYKSTEDFANSTPYGIFVQLIIY